MSLALDPSIFRAYDIRGIVDVNLTTDIVNILGMAIGSEVRSRGKQQVIVARDGRLSGPHLQTALIDGLLKTGCQVIDIGQVPTPVLYYATHTLSANSGVMLTGSHNSAEYNGLKIVIDGQTLAEQAIHQLYRRIIDQDFYTGQGSVNYASVTEEYIARVCADVKVNRPLKIVIDAGNGIPGAIAPLLFHRLGCEVIPLFCDVDGNFPHHHPDPAQEANLQDLIHAVDLHHADVGIAFDGDGDRLGIITPRGEIIWPDRQLMLYATQLLQTHPGATIIYDVKCTHHLAAVIRAHGGNPLMWKTGHSLIKSKMRETGALLAGEMSGHLFFHDRWYGFDDAFYAAARLLEIIANDSRDLSTIFSGFPSAVSTPELRLPMTDAHKFNFVDRLMQNAIFTDAEAMLIDGLRVNFADGWGLVRPSNTTPALIMRFEAESVEALTRIQQLFREQLLRLDASLQLPF